MDAADYTQAKRNCGCLWILTGLAIALQAFAHSQWGPDNSTFFNLVAGALVGLSLLSVGLLASMRISPRRQSTHPVGNSARRD